MTSADHFWTPPNSNDDTKIFWYQDLFNCCDDLSLLTTTLLCPYYQLGFYLLSRHRLRLLRRQRLLSHLSKSHYFMHLDRTKDQNQIKVL